jgi:hypothetical protein
MCRDSYNIPICPIYLYGLCRKIDRLCVCVCVCVCVYTYHALSNHCSAKMYLCLTFTCRIEIEAQRGFLTCPLPKLSNWELLGLQYECNLLIA